MKPDKFRRALMLTMLPSGVCLLLLALLWPQVSSPRSTWTDEQAVQYQHASAEVHRLAHSHELHKEGPHADSAHPELAAAKADFDQLHEQLESARHRPYRISKILAFCGIFLCGIGLWGSFAGRSQPNLR